MPTIKTGSKDSVQPEPADPLIGTRMRVWWPPTADPAKSGFSGAYWPVNIIGKKHGKYKVEYDNGDEENVLTEHLAPDDPPVGFGEETVPLQPGEFCEVSNDSVTDPCQWVGKVAKRLPNGDYLVKYPFHDAEDENIQPNLIRRIRVLDMDGWCLLRPGQKWEDGQVTSPHELETIKEETLGQFVELIGGKRKLESTTISVLDSELPSSVQNETPIEEIQPTLKLSQSVEE